MGPPAFRSLGCSLPCRLLPRGLPRTWSCGLPWKPRRTWPGSCSSRCLRCPRRSPVHAVHAVHAPVVAHAAPVIAHAAPVVAHAAPVIAPPAPVVVKEVPEPYTYSYGVADDYSKSNFQASESGDANGYVAEVAYSGEAVYPPAPAGGYPGEGHAVVAA